MVSQFEMRMPKKPCSAVGAGGDDSPNNLVSVCSSCHKAAHRKPASAERKAWRHYLASLVRV